MLSDWPDLLHFSRNLQIGRGMSRSFLKVVALGAICSVAVLAVTVRQTIAATKKANEPAPVVAAKPTKQQAKPARAELKPTSPKSPRRMKVHRKGASKAVVQPRTDLMYHGMLESPQRYDPRRNHIGAGVPDPHTLELTHDHFQELDRNQDGTIDPVERAFGRLDMDRDLHDRQPR